MALLKEKMLIMQKYKFYVLPFLKVLILCSIGIYFYTTIDQTLFIQVIKKIKIVDLFLALLSLWISMFLTGYRWYIVVNATLKTSLSCADAILQVVRGYVLSQVLPSSIGGDAYKLYQLQKKSSVIDSISVIFIDRLWGLGVFFIVGFLYWPFYFEQLNHTLVGKIIDIVFLSFFMGCVLFLLGQKIIVKKLPFLEKYSAFIFALFKRDTFFKIFSVSGLIALLLSYTVYVLALGMGLNITLGICCLIMPLIFIATALPISFAGWGVREGMFATLFSVVGVQMEEAVALSLMYGVVILISAAPLSLFFIKTKKTIQSKKNH